MPYSNGYVPSGVRACVFQLETFGGVAHKLWLMLSQTPENSNDHSSQTILP